MLQSIVHGQMNKIKVAMNVRFGSKADMAQSNHDVRYPPKADIKLTRRHVRFVPLTEVAVSAIRQKKSGRTKRQPNANIIAP
jgi:hypothetical protein